MTITNTVITQEEFAQRFVELCVNSGLRGRPRRTRDQHILLKGVSLIFDLKAEYTEAEVNERLKTWLQEIRPVLRRIDYVNMRRFLIEREYLGRSKDGSRYWLSFSSRNQPTFEQEINNLNMKSLIDSGRAKAEQKKQEFLRRQTA